MKEFSRAKVNRSKETCPSRNINNGYRGCPDADTELSLHSYNTRFSEIGGFNIKYSWANQLKQLFSIIGARILNSILQSIHTLPKHKFKVFFTLAPFCILELEDVYVDTPTLVN